MKQLSSEDFLPLDLYFERFPIRIDLAYAHDRPPNIFGQVYHMHARLWAYKPLGQTILEAASYIYDTHRLYIVVYDSLRTTDAQARMAETPHRQGASAMAAGAQPPVIASRRGRSSARYGCGCNTGA